MSEERLDITVRPANPTDRPNLIAELVDAVNNLIPAAGEGGSKWLRGKGEQEMAKVAEIKARVLTMLGNLENERQRLIHDREQARKAALQAGQAEKNRHTEKMYELETQRMEAKARAIKDAVEALRALRDMGVEITIECLAAALLPSE